MFSSERETSSTSGDSSSDELGPESRNEGLMQEEKQRIRSFKLTRMGSSRVDAAHLDGVDIVQEKKRRSFRLTRMPSLRSDANQDSVLTGQRLPFGVLSSSECAANCESTPMETAESSDYAASVSSSDEAEESKHTLIRTLSRRLSMKRMKSITRVSSMKIRRALLRKMSGGGNRKAKSKDRSTEIWSSEILTASEKDSSVGENHLSGHSSQTDAGLLPHYLKATSSSASKEVRVKRRLQKSETESSSNRNGKNLNSFSNVTRKKNFRGLTRRPSFKPLRTLTKVASMRSKRSTTKLRSEASRIQGAGVLRPTCSSALKGSKFPKQTTEVNTSENNAIKVCPYTYCSLHGHRHANLPPLRRLISMRRRLLKAHRKMQPGTWPSPRSKQSAVKTKRGMTGKVSYAPESSRTTLFAGSADNPSGSENDQVQISDLHVPDVSIDTIPNQKVDVDTAEELLFEVCNTDGSQGNVAAFTPHGDSASISADGFSYRESVPETLELSEECQSEPSVNEAISSREKITSDDNFNQKINKELSSSSGSTTYKSDSESDMKQPEADTPARMQLQEQDSDSSQREVFDCYVPDSSKVEPALEPMGTCDNQQSNTESAEELITEVHDTVEGQGNVTAFVTHVDSTSISADDLSLSYKESVLEKLEPRKEGESEPSVPNKTISTCQKNTNMDQEVKMAIGSSLDGKPYGNDSESNMKQPEAAFLSAISARMQLRGIISNGESKKQNPEPEYRFSQGIPLQGDSANPAIGDAKRVKIWNVIYQSMMTGLGSEAETSQPLDKEMNTKDDTVKLVQQAFNDILSEIPDHSSDDQSTSWGSTLDHENAEDKENEDAERSSLTLKDCDNVLGEAQETVERGEAKEHNTSEKRASEQKEGNKFDRQTSKKWSHLKKVILFRKFFKALEHARNVKPKRKPMFSPLGAGSEKVHLRHQPGEDRKNGEDWMLDNALRQVISTLAPSQRRKVGLLVQAFETLVPTESSGAHLESYPPASSPRPHVQAFSVSSSKNEADSGSDSVSQILLEEPLCSINSVKGDEERRIGLRDAEQESEPCVNDVELHKEGDKFSTYDGTFCADHKDAQDFENSIVKGKQAFGSDTENHKINLESDMMEAEAIALINVTGVTACKIGGPTSNEIWISTMTGNLAEPGAALESSQDLDKSREGKKEEFKLDNVISHEISTRDGDSKSSLAENKNIMNLRNLIYKHMVTGLGAEATTPGEAIHMKEEGDYKADDEMTRISKSNAVKLVRQAFDQILSEIPSQSPGDQSLLIGMKPADELSENNDRKSNSPYEAEKDDASSKKESDKKFGYWGSGNTQMNWRDLKNVNLLKRFVFALEEVRNINPRKPQHLRVQPDPEAEKINLRHQSIETRKNAEEWMLDHALRQVISTLAPSDRRKVALLVQAFDTILPLQHTGTRLRSAPGLSLYDLANCNSISPIEGCDETRRQNKYAASTDRTPISTTVEAPAEDWSKPVNLALASPRESTMGDSPFPKSGSTPMWSGDETGMGKQKNIRLWQMVHRHMVTSLPEEAKTPKGVVHGYQQFIDIEENPDADNESFETSKRDAVRFVRQAFDRILSEIPDQFSDDQSVDNDVSPGLEVPGKPHCEIRKDCISNSPSSSIDSVVKGPDKKQHKGKYASTLEDKQGSNIGISNQRSPKSWNDLKKVILLRKFVKSLEALTSFSPRKPHYIPVEPNSDAENIHLRLLSVEERKNSEEWMLDYALRQVISTFAPSQRRKVALLAQAFDTVSIGSDAVASAHVPLRCGSSSPVQRGDETQAKYLFSSLFDRAQSVQMNATKRLDSNSSSAEGNACPEITVASGESTNRRPSKRGYASETDHGDFTCNDIAVRSHSKGRGDPFSAYAQPKESHLQPEISGKPGMQDKKVQTDPELLYEVLYGANSVASSKANVDASENNSELLDCRNSTNNGVREFGKSGTAGEGDEKKLNAERGPSQWSFLMKESKILGTGNAGGGGKCENQKYMSLWGLLCKHMAMVDGNEPLLDENARDKYRNQKMLLGKDDSGSHLAILGEGNDVHDKSITSEGESTKYFQQHHIEAVKLMEEAIDEISLPESPDGSYDGEERGPIGSSSTDLESTYAHLCDIGKSEGQRVTEKSENETKPKQGKNWSNLKKLMILKRFVKAVEKVRKLKLHEPRYLIPDAGPETEEVNLKHLDQQGRKDADDWMVDSALQEVVAKLTPARKTKVQLLIQAFESVGCQ